MKRFSHDHFTIRNHYTLGNSSLRYRMQRTIGINNVKSRMKLNVEDNMTRVTACCSISVSFVDIPRQRELAQSNKQWKSHDDIPNM
jgi:hypothetical protein